MQNLCDQENLRGLQNLKGRRPQSSRMAAVGKTGLKRNRAKDLGLAPPLHNAA